MASYYLELELVQILLDHGVDIHAENSFGQTPFRQVFESKHYSLDLLNVAQLLVEHGADANTWIKNHEC